jgi:3-hydroxyisobutyrate dehydrogenase
MLMSESPRGRDDLTIGFIGFIGLGNMGAPMAANLCRAGLPVLLHDASAGVATALAARIGGTAVTTTDELAAADVIITMLPTGSDVASVLLDAPDAIGAHLRAGTVVVDMSSADPVGTRLLSTRLAKIGVHMIDSPVSGGVPRAEAGTLALMIGGDNAVIERVRPVLALLGDRHFEVGSIGCGHAMKALNNFVAGTAFVAASEAVSVGQRFGLDPDVMMDVMNASTARCFNTEMVMKQQVISGEYASGFTLGLLTKDVGIAARLATAIGSREPLCRVIADRLAEARDAVGAGEDHTRAAQFWDSHLPPKSAGS